MNRLTDVIDFVLELIVYAIAWLLLSFAALVLSALVFGPLLLLYLWLLN